MKKKIIISLVAVLGLVAIITGITYAFFSFTKHGSTENIIRAGSIAFHYDEISGKGRGINLFDALPADSDEAEKTNNNYFDFRITAESDIAQIPYTVTAKLSDDTTLDLDVIKVYLTEIVNGEEKPILYTTLDQLPEVTFKDGELELYTDTVPVTGQSYDRSFRLRIWIGEDTNFISGAYSNKKLSLTVNVYTNQGSKLTEEHLTKSDDTSIKMISGNNTYLLNKSEETNIDYEVAVPNEVNTINLDIITRNIAATSTVEELGQTLSYNDDAYIKRMSNSTTYNLLTGDNYFKATVTSADNSKTAHYNIKVTRELSRDNTLTYLGVDGYSFTEVFDKDTLSYETVGLEVDTVTLTGDKGNEAASINGLGEKTLTNWGANTFTVTVTPEDPTAEARTYTIVVNKVRPEAPSIEATTNEWTNTNPTVSVGIQGTAISGIDHYEVYKTTSTDLPTEDTIATTTTDNEYVLNEDGTYHIYYRTVSTNGHKSVWSNGVVVKRDATGPTLATLTSAPSTKTQITANFTATTALSEIKEIKCYYGTTNNPTTEVAATGDNCVFTGLSQDTTYYFKKCTTSNSNATTCSEVSSKLTAGHVYKFNYNGTDGSNGSVQSWTIPYTGTYKLEAWGAEGGSATYNNNTGYGGKGGYSQGTTTLTANNTLYVAVGGKGLTTNTITTINGGYNGGGQSILRRTQAAVGSGGGATSIGYVNGTIGNGITADTANQVLLIAGGGAGGAVNYVDGNRSQGNYYGGHGGGSTYECNTGATYPCNSNTATQGSAANQELTSYSNNPINNYGSVQFRIAQCGAGGGISSYTIIGVGNNLSTSSGGLGLNNITGGTMQSGVRSGHGYAQITVESIN